MKTEREVSKTQTGWKKLLIGEARQKTENGSPEKQGVGEERLLCTYLHWLASF